MPSSSDNRASAHLGRLSTLAPSYPRRRTVICPIVVIGGELAWRRRLTSGAIDARFGHQRAPLQSRVVGHLPNHEKPPRVLAPPLCTMQIVTVA